MLYVLGPERSPPWLPRRHSLVTPVSPSKFPTTNFVKENALCKTSIAKPNFAKAKLAGTKCAEVAQVCLADVVFCQPSSFRSHEQDPQGTHALARLLVSPPVSHRPQSMQHMYRRPKSLKPPGGHTVWIGNIAIDVSKEDL